MKIKNEVVEGNNFHYMVLSNAFNEICLDYRHFMVKKVFKKTCRVQTLKEVGCHFSDKVNLQELQSTKDYKNNEVRIYFKTIDEATKYWLKGAAVHHTNWKKQIEGYTSKHVDYDFMLFKIELMKKYRELLKNYSIEKHEELVKWRIAKYKKFKRGRFRWYG